MDQLLKRPGRPKGIPSVQWSAADVRRLRQLASSNTLFMAEIAVKMGRTPVSVRWKAHKLGIWSKPVGRMAEWNRKHAHLREAVMRYYLTHTVEETAQHFGITKREFKSCITAGYKDPRFKKLRKEWRPHTPWSTDDWLFMCRNSGVQPRQWIGRKLKRGDTYNSVKDSLAKFRGLGKYMNGMPLGWAVPIFGEEIREQLILTKAGPTGGGRYAKKGSFMYQILPWVTADRLIKAGCSKRILGKGKCRPERKAAAPRLKIDEEIVVGVRAMAKFQRWIFCTDSERAIVRHIRKSLRRR